MTKLEIVFNESLDKCFNTLKEIEKTYFRKGEFIGDLLRNKTKERDEILINIIDYNTLASGITICELMRKLIYCKGMNDIQFRSYLHILIKYEQYIKSINKLSVELWNNYNFTDSGVIPTLKSFTIELNDMVISNLMPDSSHMTDLSNTDFDTRLSEAFGILKSQIYVIIIAAVNVVICGQNTEFYGKPQEHLCLMLEVDKFIRLSYK